MSKHCETCLNAKTPICKDCTYVETVKGESRPTNYCWYDTTILDEMAITDLASLIENRTKNHLPIPVKYVLKYNELLEARYGTKEDISAL